MNAENFHGVAGDAIENPVRIFSDRCDPHFRPLPRPAPLSGQWPITETLSRMRLSTAGAIEG